METKYQAAKNYNHIQDAKLHSYIDTKDTVNHWCVGMIADIDDEKHQFKVHFEGWTHKYDERFAPFRRHTVGYTGQKKSAFREFKFSHTEEVKMKERIDEMIKTDFKAFGSPVELNQVLRGELYFYVDSLISLTQSNEELIMIYMFMRNVFDLIFKWMEIFPQYLKNYQEAQLHPQLFLIDYDTAISQCGNELFSILEKCFGGCARCQRFFDRFGNEPMYIDNEKLFTSKSVRNKNYQCSLVNAFCNMKGLDNVLKFIRFETKDAKGKTIKGCPFNLVMKILNPLVPLLDQILDKAIAQQFAEEVQKILIDRLDNLQDFEIKELDKDVIRETIEVLRNYMMVTDPSNADMRAELQELSIAQKYIRCPFFERRVRGLNDLKDMFYKVHNFTFKKMQLEHTNWLNLEKYSKWVIDEKILEFIFVEQPHVELIKRSSELLKLLTYDDKTFTPDIIEMLWSCCREKHEEIVRASLELIKDIAEFLPQERLAQLFSKIQSIKENEYDEKLVNFLKNYTIRAMKNLSKIKRGGEQKQGLVNSLLRNKKETKIDESKYYDLGKFWLIFQDSNKVLQKVKDLALNSLIEILSELNDKEIKDQFISLCLENIQRQDTFYSSLVFLRKILATFQPTMSSSLRTGNTTNLVTTVLETILKKVDFFDLLIQNSHVYLSIAYQTLKQKGKPQAERVSQQYFIPQATHEDFIKIIFKMIEFILVNSRSGLSFDNVDKMFKIFVINPISDIETNLFFNLITKENESSQGNQRKFLIHDNVRKDVFNKIFCNTNLFDIEKVNLEGFNCFRKLFIIVNQQDERLIEVTPKEERITVNNLNQLSGMETLWQIAIQCKNQSVKDRCKDFLVDLYLRVKIKSNTQKKLTNDLFFNRCLKQFENCKNQPDHQLNCLRLIKTFISRFDGDHILEEDMSQFDPKELKTISVTLNPDKVTIQIKIHGSQKFWQLKRKMANQFKLKLSEFFIKTKNGPLEEAVYDEQIKEYKIEALHINRVSIEEMEREFPRYIIGCNGDYVSLLLNMLDSGQEECKREVLSLFEILPINSQHKLYIKENMTKWVTIEDWKQFFFHKSEKPVPDTCYYLMALEDLLVAKRDGTTVEAQQQEQQQKLDFIKVFVANRGHEFLFDTFIKLEKTNLERDIVKTKLLTTLLNLIYALMNKNVQVFLKDLMNLEQIQKLIHEVFNGLSYYINKVVQQQSKSAESLKDERNMQKDTQILINAYKLISKTTTEHPQVMETMYQFNGIDTMIRNALIEIEVENIQQLTNQLITNLSTVLDTTNLLQVKPSYFFMNIFITQGLQSVEQCKSSEKTKIFFDTLNEVFMKTEIYKKLEQITSIYKLIELLAGMIIKREIFEISTRDEDFTLQGLFMFLKNILNKYPEARDNYSEKNKFLEYVIHDCLFHKETRSHVIQKQKAMPPKCKNQKTRDRCLELLNELCIRNNEGISVLINYLRKYTMETFWRTPRKADWQISIHQQERSLTGFVGLKNAWCICYMNSLMQQLFMIPTFRKSILEVDDELLGKISAEENPLHQLKMIFGGLSEIEKQYYNPKNFFSAFKDIDGSPIDPLVQRDVEEFFTMMIDKVENLIKGKKEEKVIKNLFSGVFANEFICKGCPHYSQREEPFLTIQVQVKNKHSLKESLDAFVEGEMLEGDNAYFCEKCEKKVNTLKRCCIKRLPNVMFVVLKRFEFNYDLLQKIKINDYCEFPNQLNMSEYTQEHLAKKDLLKEMEDKNLTYDDLNDDQREIHDKQVPQKYYDYKLKGAIIHIGTSEQGHYISISQDRESNQGKWYEFNDHLVKEFDPADIPYEAFGGDDDTFLNNFNMQNLQGTQQQMANAVQQMKTKIKNAYILIYERDDFIEMEKFSEIMDDPNFNSNEQILSQKYKELIQSRTTSAQIQIPTSIHEAILEKNKKFWLSRFIFNKTYIESIYSIFRTIDIPTETNYLEARSRDLQQTHEYNLEIFKYLTTFFLTTVIRAKERKTVPNFMKLIRESLTKSVNLSVWFLETFTSQELIKEFLIDCPVPDMKRFVGGLLRTAMKTVYPYETSQIREICQSLESKETTPGGDQHQLISIVEATQKGQKQIINYQVKGEHQHSSSPQIQNLAVYTLSQHNEKLPVLIMFINSVIHLSVSSHTLKNIQLTAQFYQVLAHFSELGLEARWYLLKMKTLGRQLDIFFNGQANAPIASKYRNEYLTQVPLFVIEKEFYLTRPPKKGQFQLSLIEKKQALMQASPSVVFISYPISVLARSCRFVKDVNYPQAQDDLNYRLDNEEISMFLNTDNDQWWNCCSFKVSRNAISDMFSHISYENKDYSNQILGTILNNIQRSTFDVMKAYERPLVKMLMIKDQFQADRTKIALTRLQEIMKMNINFYKEVDSLIEIVLKLAQRCPMVVENLTKQSSFYRLIEQFSKENPHFPLNQTRIKLFKLGQLNWNSVKNTLINQGIIDRISAYNKKRLQDLNSLVTKETPVNEDCYDSDDDMYKHEFSEKERIDFWQGILPQSNSIDQGESWFSGTIEIALDEMVKCQSDVNVNGKPHVLWVETDSDKLSKVNTQAVSEKKRTYNYYMTLLRHLQAQMNPQMSMTGSTPH